MRMKKIQEGLGELADMAERDHEVQMARADLYKLAKYAIKLHDMLKGVSEAEGIEGWQQAKITKAADYISSVYHALDYDMKFANGGQMAPEMPVESKTYVESLQAKLAEKAVSQNQQQAAGIALAAKRGGKKPKAGTASANMMNMSTAELEKIAGTKHKGLPQSANEDVYASTKKHKVNEIGVVNNQAKRGLDQALEAFRQSEPEKAQALEQFMTQIGYVPTNAQRRQTGNNLPAMNLGDSVVRTSNNICSDCGKPSYTTLPEEKQKGVDGKVCWKGYRRQGTKMKGGRRVDNCVKVG